MFYNTIVLQCFKHTIYRFFPYTLQTGILLIRTHNLKKSQIYIDLMEKTQKLKGIVRVDL